MKVVEEDGNHHLRAAHTPWTGKILLKNAQDITEIHTRCKTRKKQMDGWPQTENLGKQATARHPQAEGLESLAGKCLKSELSFYLLVVRM